MSQKQTRRFSSGDPLPEKRVSLGRLRVTISDIEALLAKLRNEYQAKDIVLQAGTVLNTPNDLRASIDAELETLSITVVSDQGRTPWGSRTPGYSGDDLVVFLEINNAIAVGILPLVEIVEAWARPRQFTGFPPRTVVRGSRKRIIGHTVVGPLLILQVASWLGVFLGSSTLTVDVSAGNGIFGLTLLAWIAYDWFTKPMRVANFAVIVPATLEEFRKDQIARKRFYITTGVAISASLIASATAFTIALIRS